MSYFGTDGIRGPYGQLPITPDYVLKLGYAAGCVLKRHAAASKAHAHVQVVLGKDPRISSYVLEAALQSGLNAAGVDVLLLGPMPTPAIAHLTRAFHADAGVVVSASHNPFTDNGVKFFSAQGKKLDDQIQHAINAELENPSKMDSIKALGKSYRIDDAQGRYIEFCKSTFPYHRHLKGLKIVLDCANGAGYKVAPKVFSELGANVIPMFNAPDGYNINDNCGSTHIAALQARVQQENADVGIALDGDADRILMVDHCGRVIDGDAILYILATQGSAQPAGVVGTLMSNLGLEQALAAKNIAFNRANVGDRYVLAELDKQGWVLGGETSGHILTLDKSTTGDAIIAALQVLAVMTERQCKLADLVVGLTSHPQTLINIKIANKTDPYAHPELAKLFNSTQQQLGSQGRLLIRKSGTEPLIRVMVEASDGDVSKQVAQLLANAIQNTLG